MTTRSGSTVTTPACTRHFFPAALALLFIFVGVAVIDGRFGAARGQSLEPAPAATSPASSPDLASPPVSVSQPAAGPPAAIAPRATARQGAPLPHELSPWAMFMAADIVVKGVMIGLAVASILAWAIWLGKFVEIAFAKRRVHRTIAMLDACNSLGVAAERTAGGRDALALMVQSAQREVERLGADRQLHAGIKERIASELHRIEVAAGRQAATGTGVLATIGSTAPFIGLFGTVWGIMNSFIGISKSQTTNLAVVAPGIAEALLATAIGLVAAIPAVIFYNQIARAIQSYRASVGDGAALVGRIVSRDLDVRSFVPHLRAAAE